MRDDIELAEIDILRALDLSSDKALSEELYRIRCKKIAYQLHSKRMSQRMMLTRVGKEPMTDNKDGTSFLGKEPSPTEKGPSFLDKGPSFMDKGPSFPGFMEGKESMENEDLEALQMWIRDLTHCHTHSQ